MVKASNKNGSIFKKRVGNNMNNMLKTYRTMELLLLDILEKLYMKYSNTSSCEKLHAVSMQFFLCLKIRQISKKTSKNITKYYDCLRGTVQELRIIRLHGSVKRIGVCCSRESSFARSKI